MNDPTISVRSNTQLADLVEQVRSLVTSARQTAVVSINTLQVRTNYEIGRLIVEHEQKGSQRAEYRKELLIGLSTRLTAEFGSGYSPTNLEYMRKFYRLWSNSSHKIPQTVSEESAAGQSVIPQTLPEESSPKNFALNWSHYVLLITIQNDQERRFYEIEAARNNWSLRELKRQVASALYERLALSRDKQQVVELAEQGHTLMRPADVIKDPYILEFLGLDEKPHYYLISKVQLHCSVCHN